MASDSEPRVVAATLQGAIAGGVKALIDHGGARGIPTLDGRVARRVRAEKEFIPSV
jgi:hypothetical protein